MTTFDFFYDLAVDTQSSNEGKFFGFNGFRFKLAMTERPEFRAKAASLWKAKLNGKDMDDLDKDAQLALAREIANETAAEMVLLGWEGTIPYKGEQLSYSVENAKKLLGLPKFRSWVEEYASDESNFRVARPTEEDTKN